ncbi:MAG: redox-regulated ATPase YchF [Elusimicrobiota bacterium]
MEIGIVGLPNVGKSTLFNALTAANAPSSNYPFTTIEPNIGVVSVPDARLQRLSEIFQPKKTTPATVRFVDIAGLVKGASKGEGLGNQFLANIREVDAVLHLVRLFKDEDVVHTLGDVDPRRDVEIVETELILADLAGVERRCEKAEGKARSGDKAAKAELALLETLRSGLNAGRPARALDIPLGEIKDLFLLTAKPVLFVGNTGETPEADAVGELAALAVEREAASLTLCGKIEAEIAELPPEDRGAFLSELGLERMGLERVIESAYRLLGLESYFTHLSDEVRAWTIRAGMRSPQAAGVIHTDFEKGFIRADVYAFSDLDKHGAEAALRAKGLIRSEGKDYIVRDGDVCNFKFSS